MDAGTAEFCDADEVHEVGFSCAIRLAGAPGRRSASLTSSSTGGKPGRLETEAGTTEVCDTEREHESCSSLDPPMASGLIVAKEVVLTFVSLSEFWLILFMSLWTEAAKACPGSVA